MSDCVRLGREFFSNDTLSVARELVGKVLVRRTAEGTARAMVVETEAYLGERDDAAHTYKQKSTRTSVAYGKSGLAYIYLIYGMYCCFNVTTGPLGTPEMVLLRALEPLDGHELMAKRRRTDVELSLCSGPGKLCMALGVDRSLYGTDLCESEELFFEDSRFAGKVSASPRVGIDYAEKCRDMPWRFFAEGNPFVSKVKLSGRRSRQTDQRLMVRFK